MTARSRPPQQTLRRLRQARGWRQQDVADWLGASLRSVIRWEQGVAVPHVRTRKRLADLFGVKVSEITFGRREEQP